MRDEFGAAKQLQARLQAAEAVCRAAECLRIPEYGNKPRGWDKLGEALAAWEATCKS